MNSARQAIKVVAGVIWHPDNSSCPDLIAAAGKSPGESPAEFAGTQQCTNDRLLLALRQPHQHQGGLWEFPGGKVDADESGFDALKRELHEEIAIDVVKASSWLQVSHDYPDKSVDLEFWHVFEFSGEPEGREQQELRWIRLSELHAFPVPKANQTIVDALLG